MWNLAIKRSVTFTMIFLVLLFFGIWSLMRINPDILPNIQIPIAGVICSYSGTAPEDFENLIVKFIEGACATVSGMKNMRSIITEGQSITLLEFEWGYDMDKAAIDIREKVDLARTFLPKDMDKPLVIKFDPTIMPIIMLSFSGDIELKTARKLAEDFIKPSLEKLDGVASAMVVGGLKREIQVNLSKEMLISYGVSINDVIASLSMQNLNLPSGEVSKGDEEIIVRAVGEFKSTKDIENTIVGYKGNVPIQIKDIGVVVDTFEEKNSIVRIDGNEGVLIQVYKESGAVTVDVSKKVSREIKNIQKLLPKKTEIKTVYDMSTFINRSLGRIRSNIVVGGLLAILILYLFLQSFGSTLTIALSIPISIIITFAAMDIFGITLNMMSMGGLALSVGMLVDNAIVVLENIYRRRKEEKEDRFESAINGTKEVATAITASTLTTIMVFLPVILIPGMIGILTKDFALTVIVTLLVSLFVALTLIPMISAKFIGETKIMSSKIDNIQRVILSFIDKMIERYKDMVRWCLKRKKLVIFSTFIIFMISISLIKPFGFIGTEFMSRMETGNIRLVANFPPGTNLKSKEEAIREIEKIFKDKVPEKDIISAIVGDIQGFGFSEGKNTATIMVRLVKKELRKDSQFEIIERIRPDLKTIPGTEINVSEQEMSILLMGALSSTIEINIFGNDLKELQKTLENLKSKIEKIDGIRNVQLSTEERSQEIIIDISKEKAQMYGLSSILISNTLNSYLQGKTATIFRDKGEDYYVRVQLEKKDRNTLDDLINLPLKTPFGTTILLSDVAKFKKDYGPTTITRKNQKRFVTLSASYFGRDLGSIVKDINKEIKKLPLQEGYYIEFGGEIEQKNEAFKWLTFAVIGAIFLVYMVMCALYESFIDPFVIMFTVPLYIIGVIWMLFLTGTTLNVMSLIGVAVLAGISVNNGIVMVDYINQLRKTKKMKLEDAVVLGASRRLRPILMTSLTTLIAMIPMAIGAGEGGSLRAPLGRAVIGGLFSSTLLSLFFLPVLYTVFESRIKTRKK